jgi:hypothetical protein
MKTNGYRVLRFWNNDVMKNLDGVLQVIVEAFSALPPPHPRPLPTTRFARGGRGEDAPSS